MTQEELRKYIIGILLDIRGDNEYPEYQILRANASLLLHKFNQYVAEVIGEDTEDLESQTVQGGIINYFDTKGQVRNELRAEQRKRAALENNE